ncbi:MAG: hypothetical protein AUG75_01630 [Cyanobacteria bacterium 13_1_20CM_4_61_6]|nr:MAG: hypothetical protein AUG75_01630 [Cyanobacteria bacterium 13_1_20CM_4_61_6]
MGFVCATTQDYIEAIGRIGEISPAACRAMAMSKYHYMRMTRDYVREYEREISRRESIRKRGDCLI